MDNNIETCSAPPASETAEPAKRKITFGKAYGQFTLLFTALCAMLITTAVFQLIINTIAEFYFPQIIDTDWYYWVLALIPMYCVGLPTAIIIIMFAERDRGGIKTEKISFGRWLRYLCVAITFMYAGSIVGSIVSSLLGNASNPVDDMLSGSSVWISFTATVVLAPVIEEFLFRKLLIDRMSAYGEKRAVFLSALAFGLFHGNFSQFFYAFAVGLIFGYIYIRTRRIWYTITLHMAVNFICGELSAYFSSLNSNALQLVQKFISSGEPADMQAALDFLKNAILPILASSLFSLAIFAVFILGIVFFFKDVKKLHYEKCRYDVAAGKLNVATYLNIGFIIFIAICAGLFAASLL